MNTKINCSLERQARVDKAMKTIRIGAYIEGLTKEDLGKTCLFSGNEFLIVEVKLETFTELADPNG